MSAFDLQAVEQGLHFLRDRAAVLASDVANARTQGFVAVDIDPVARVNSAGAVFAEAVKEVGRGKTGVLEYAMGATAQNSVAYKALAEQERAMLKEFRTVAEEARR
ncbi:MAG: hypothetical protein GIW99_06130 [Candidatus Eremiobacteraeota bacterium]|nr:hypothetical protein [Candidatus Eremiobacteraeota bacterium]MBC5827245.1 hypothetical protein [Candidatus Eremiobacteraeota bacterium]